MSKILALGIIMLLEAFNLVFIESAAAQSIPKPSVPTFTIELVGSAYTQETTYTLNSSTGQIEAHLGYTNQYSNILIKIKNQPFDSSYGKLYYDVQFKYHLAEGWRTFHYDGPNPNVQSTVSDYTNFTLAIDRFNLNGTQIDIQVQALLGGYSYGRNMSSQFAFGGYRFGGEKSGWSGTQTVTVPANVQLTPTPAPQSSVSTYTSTISPTAPSNTQETAQDDLPLTWLLIGSVVGLSAVVALLVVVVGLMRRRISVLERKQNGT